MDMFNSINKLSLPIPELYLVNTSNIVITTESVHRHQCISQLGHELIYKIYQDKYNLSPTLLRGRYGKPYIKDDYNFHFNISHSGNWLGCAIFHAPIGLDIQKKKFRPSLTVSNKIFTNQEIDTVYFSGGYNNSTFFRIWSAKESYVKCIGTGFHTPLNSFSVNENTIEIKGNVSHNIYYYNELHDYTTAICTQNKVSFLSVHQYSIDEFDT